MRLQVPKVSVRLNEPLLIDAAGGVGVLLHLREFWEHKILFCRFQTWTVLEVKRMAGIHFMEPIKGTQQTLPRQIPEVFGGRRPSRGGHFRER